MNKRKRKKYIWITAVALVLALAAGAGASYFSDYYKADMEAIQAFSADKNVEQQKLDDNTFVFGMEDAAAGFIFYPGGKVEYTAYIPLMEECASKGILCVLVEMPFHLAVFDINAADGIQAMYPEIEDWYIGGHSLGGAMAASYIEEHSEDYEGLILLGSYSASDLSETELDVLSVYGSEDKVLNREKYDTNKANLPEELMEMVIEGGCHAYFGMYGAQDGDGIPAVTNKEQIILTADAIIELINMD